VSFHTDPGVLAMTLVVRDEEDILEANLDYHLAQGVDVILAMDHGSSDRTSEILSRYAAGGRVHWLRDEERPFDQARHVNQLLRLAADEHGADWVIHGDADEFWMPAVGSLRDVLAAVPRRYGYLIVERNNFLPTADDGGPFHQRLVVRERRSLNLRGTGLPPKVAQRPAASTVVLPGNHALVTPVLEPAPDIGAVEVLHFPMRSFGQFERKVIKIGVGYECLPDRTDDTGIDQLQLLALQRQGELGGYYAAKHLDRERIDRGLAAGDLVEDRRLQAFLTNSNGPNGDSLAARRLMRRAWEERAAAADSARDAVAAADSLREELARTRRDFEAASATLATIRASRIMRYTAALRRLYYRRRDTK
jgi:Glycosyl transferase family 2